MTVIRVDTQVIFFFLLTWGKSEPQKAFKVLTKLSLRAWWHGGGEPQVGEVTHLGGVKY